MKIMQIIMASLLVSSFAMAAPQTLNLRINSHFVRGEGDQKIEHKWKNTVEVESGKSYVVNYSKKKHCINGQCEEHEFKTEIKPEFDQGQNVIVYINFYRKAKNQWDEIEGEIVTTVDNFAEFQIKNHQAPSSFYLSIYPRF